MSLINQVLKDIETRHVDINPSEQVVSARSNVQSALRQQHYQTKHLLLVACATACISVFLSWVLMHQSSVNHGLVASSFSAKSAARNDAVVSSVSSLRMSSVESFNIVQNLDDVDLYFDVSTLPLVKVELNEAHDALTLVLFRTQDQGALKSRVVSGLGAFDIQAIPEDENLVVHIKMPFSAKIAKIDPIDGNKPRIHVSLLHIEASAHASGPSNGKRLDQMVVANTQVITNQTRPNHYNATPALVSDSRAYEQAISLIKSGQVEQAGSFIRSHISRSVVDSRLIITLVELLVQQNRFRDAMVVIQGAVTLEPQKPALIKVLAQIQFMQHQEQQALTTLSSLSPPMARHPRYYGLMASIYLKTGEAMLSGALYRRLVEFQPHNVNWWIGLGLSMQSLQEVNIAIESYRRALKLGVADQPLRQFVTKQLSVLQ
jgi:Flp pilus assembly protein TadD